VGVGEGRERHFGVGSCVCGTPSCAPGVSYVVAVHEYEPSAADELARTRASAASP
jgi:hypothetical protein